MEHGLPEHEIRSRLSEGGHIRGVFVVEIKVAEHTEFLPFFRTSWNPAFRPMRTARTKAHRSYRDPRLLFQLIREFGFTGAIVMFVGESEDLGRFLFSLMADGGAVEQALATLDKAMRQ